MELYHRTLAFTNSAFFIEHPTVWITVEPGLGKIRQKLTNEKTIRSKFVAGVCLTLIVPGENNFITASRFDGLAAETARARVCVRQKGEKKRREEKKRKEKKT